jgi:hypothetical protein
MSVMSVLGAAPMGLAALAVSGLAVAHLFHVLAR